MHKKAIPFKIPKDKNQSIKIQIDDGDHFYDKLHYHPEIQITVIIKGRGILYGGNNMLNFQEEDVFIFGANIPHVFKKSVNYYTNDSPGVLSYSLFFDLEYFGNGLLQIPEMTNVKLMLSQAKRGIHLKSSTIVRMVSNAIEHNNEKLILTLIEILVKLLDTNKNFINSESYNLSLEDNVGDRLNTILDYTFAHLQAKISLQDVAAVANLSVSQFSRYFKSHTRKSYIQFLNELRIETACNLILEGRQSIKQICYEVGFQNVSNFNRKFKEIKGLSPRQYKKQ